MKLFFSIVLIIGPALLLGLLGKPTGAITALVVAGTVAAIFLNLEKFERFTGPGGTSAELRKKLDEAAATLNNLREVAKPLIISTLNNITHANRWGGMDHTEKHQLVGELETTARELAIDSDPDIQTARQKENCNECQVLCDFRTPRRLPDRVFP